MFQWRNSSLIGTSDSERKPCKANRLLNDLRRGGFSQLGYCQIGITEAHKSPVSALKTHDQEMVVLLHNERMENPAEIYLQRWQIETMFRAFKTSGFNLESTHVTMPDRLIQLMAVLVLAFCFAYKAGNIAIFSILAKARLFGSKCIITSLVIDDVLRD